VLVDIAIPRDLDERLGDLDGVFLFGVDDLRDVVDEGRQIRQGATARVEELLHEHLNDFVDWYRAREAVPAIVHLRSALEQETANELERWRGHPAQDAIAKALRGMAGRFLHGPSEALRELGQEGQGVEASAWMSRIFGTVDPSTKE
jgi:glutamyl-tRNA reductase